MFRIIRAHSLISKRVPHRVDVARKQQRQQVQAQDLREPRAVVDHKLQVVLPGPVLVRSVVSLPDHGLQDLIQAPPAP